MDHHDVHLVSGTSGFSKLQDTGDYEVTHKVAISVDQDRRDIHDYRGQARVTIGVKEECGLGEATSPEVLDFRTEGEKVFVHKEC